MNRKGNKCTRNMFLQYFYTYYKLPGICSYHWIYWTLILQINAVTCSPCGIDWHLNQLLNVNKGCHKDWIWKKQSFHLSCKYFLVTIRAVKKIHKNMIVTHPFIIDWLPGSVCTAWQTTCGDRHTLTVTTWQRADGRVLKTKNKHINIKKGRFKRRTEQTQW